MKRYTLCLIVILTCSTSESAPSQDKRSKLKPRANTATDVRQIDFKNLTYNINGKRVRLRNGQYIKSISPYDKSKNGYVFLRELAYGDITNDGKDEAVLLIYTGSDEAPDNKRYLFIYTIRNGRTVMLTALEVSRESWIDIKGIKIEDSVLSVERYEGNAFVETMKYRWNGTRLIQM